MKLGILVNTNRHRDEVIGLAEAALTSRHEVTIFCMDEGTRLLEDPAFTSLSQQEGIKMGFCSHNAEGFGVKTDGLDKRIVQGSQYDNSVMNNQSGKVIVL